MRVWCASSPPVKQPRLNVNIHPRCNKYNTALRHQGRLCCINDTHLVAISSLLPGKLISFLFQTLQTAARRTYCENVYLSGRHRQQWLCVRIIIQTCSSHRAETERLLSIWPLGGCTPSVLEGDTATATHLFLKLITRGELHFHQVYLFL